MSNRLLVMPTDSHITEERRIEEKLNRGWTLLRKLTAELDELLYQGEWGDASAKAREIAITTKYMERLEYRMNDVKSINDQFKRIDEQIERIESLKEK